MHRISVEIIPLAISGCEPNFHTGTFAMKIHHYQGFWLGRAKTVLPSPSLLRPLIVVFDWSHGRNQTNAEICATFTSIMHDYFAVLLRYFNV